MSHPPPPLLTILAELSGRVPSDPAVHAAADALLAAGPALVAVLAHGWGTVQVLCANGQVVEVAEEKTHRPLKP